jgi:hypothetical protein
MSWRKSLVRLLVFTMVACLAAAGWCYQRWTSPEVVRLQVLEQIAKEFPGAQVSVESAHLKLLGGIALTDARLVRRDDLDKADLLFVPAAVVYYDKEQVLDGKLAIRRIELDRPRLRVLRLPDGRWNLANVLAPFSGKRLPTILVKNGTLVFEDRQADGSKQTFEVTGINLRVVNDPFSTIQLQGSATSDLARDISVVRATWHRDRTEFDMDFELAGIGVGPGPRGRLAGMFPALAERTFQVEGTAKVCGRLRYSPEAPEPFHYDVTTEVSGGPLSCPRLPFVLAHFDASCRCVNGLVTEGKLRATSGEMGLEISVKDLVPSADCSEDSFARELAVKLEHLPLNTELFGCLPERWELLREIQADYQPVGHVGVVYTFERDAAGAWRRTCIVTPEDASASAVRHFPYRLEHITGTVRHTASNDHPDVVDIDLVGLAGDRPVHIKGEVVGKKSTCGVAIDIWGDEIPIDEKLQGGLLRKQHQDLVRAFRPAGSCSVRVLLRRTLHATEFKNRYVVELHQCRMRHEVFPYPVENVSGVLDIGPDHWEFRDFKGWHKGGEFLGWARSFADHAAPDGYVEVGLSGSGILLDAELERALLRPELQAAWRTLQPTGRLGFNGRIGIHSASAQPPTFDMNVYPQGCGIRPTFFPYALSDIHGEVHYANGKVELKNMRARHGSGMLTLREGRLQTFPGGGQRVEFNGLVGYRLVLDKDLVAALPPALKKACAALDLPDPFMLKTDLVVQILDEARGPDTYWDGALILDRAHVGVGVPFENVSGQIACRGRYNGQEIEGIVGNLALSEATLFRQPFQNIRSAIVVDKEHPNVLQLPGLWAQLYGGQVYGPISVAFGPTPAYEIRLTASQIKLEEFGRHELHTSAQLAGEAQAQLYLRGNGADPRSLVGTGMLDVPNGKIYNLPVLLDLLKFLSLRFPDRTFFEEAHARFDIIGPRMRINQFNLYGNVVSLRGRGAMNLDGTDIDMDLHMDWARLDQMLTPGVKKVPQALSNQLLTIHAKGQLGNVQFTQEAMPVLFDPFKRAWKEMTHSDAAPTKER